MRAAAGAGDAPGRWVWACWSSWSGRWSCLLSERLFAPPAEVGVGVRALSGDPAVRRPGGAGQHGAAAAGCSGLQDSRRPLLLMLLTNGINAVLAILFVFGLGLATAGVATATVLAEYAGLAIGLLIVRGTWRRQGGWPGWPAIMVLAPISPPARGQPRPVPAQPAAGGGLRRLRRHRLAPGRGGARRQCRADELLHRRRLRARRLRPRGRGHGRAHRRCARPAGLSRRRAGELRQRRPARGR